MKVNVRLFARYREAAGRDRIEIDLPDGGTVEGAWDAVTSRVPALAAYRPFTLFAVANDYVPADRRLAPGEELCLFPPVSGGAPEAPGDLIAVTTEPLSERAMADAVADPGAGAIGLFSGVVRNHTGERQTKYLEYEAHTPMAEAKMREIATMLRSRWPGLRRIAIVHRIGRLEIGESSVMIAVSSPHRREAFEACHLAIDTLKETVPVWKKEYFEDGEVWVGLQSECDHRH
jgi:MoaE-MoaD fusion protein